MTDSLSRVAEERFGIKADPFNVEELRKYILNTYGKESPEILEKVFSSGEAVGFLTVGETYFFREPAHFTFLTDMLSSFEEAGIRICSAATSIGCEAYSIAMLIEAYNKSMKPVSYHIDAFDINPKVIETAHRGFYSERTLREDGSCFRYMAVPYLKKTETGYQIDDALKKNIRFFVLYLMDELSPKTYDLIFFRNAFIYFSPPNRDRILSNLTGVLEAGGTLIMGVSETAGAHHADLEAKNRNDVFYFQKAAGTKVPGEPKFPIYRNGLVI
jgi:chemotaxis protein methyltransferase CheR